MNSKQKAKVKKIWDKLLVQRDLLEELVEQVQEETEMDGEDDWDPVPEILDEASNLLYNCCYKLEDVCNS